MSQTPPSSPTIDPATGLPRGQTIDPRWEITPRDTAMRQKAGVVLLDVRRDDEQTVSGTPCRIEGSVHIPMHLIEQRLDDLDDALGSDRAAPLIVYCHHGRRSLAVAATLRAHGFTGAVSMAGGIDAWAAAIDPGVPRYER